MLEIETVPIKHKIVLLGETTKRSIFFFEGKPGIPFMRIEDVEDDSLWDEFTRAMIPSVNLANGSIHLESENCKIIPINAVLQVEG